LRKATQSPVFSQPCVNTSQLLDWRKSLKHFSLAKENHITDSQPAIYRHKTAAHKARSSKNGDWERGAFPRACPLLLRPPGFFNSPTDPVFTVYRKTRSFCYHSNMFLVGIHAIFPDPHFFKSSADQIFRSIALPGRRALP
jgi:hypothetical protein